MPKPTRDELLECPTTTPAFVYNAAGAQKLRERALLQENLRQGCANPSGFAKGGGGTGRAIPGGMDADDMRAASRARGPEPGQLRRLFGVVAPRRL